MKKVIITFVVLLAILVLWIWNNRAPVHNQLDINDIKSVALWGDGIPEGHKGRIATTDEIAQLVDWYNTATNIRENKKFAGSTPTAGIRILLKSGKQIHILNSGKDFEVQRENGSKRISYWAEEVRIRDLLKDLSE